MADKCEGEDGDIVKTLRPMLDAWVISGDMIFSDMAVMVSNGEVKVYKQF